MMLPGIHDIAVNASTGSVTVHYSVDAHPEPHTSIDQIQSHFAVLAVPATKIDEMLKLGYPLPNALRASITIT
jgi:hypothetical protein